MSKNSCFAKNRKKVISGGPRLPFVAQKMTKKTRFWRGVWLKMTKKNTKNQQDCRPKTLFFAFFLGRLPILREKMILGEFFSPGPQKSDKKVTKWQKMVTDQRYLLAKKRKKWHFLKTQSSGYDRKRCFFVHTLFILQITMPYLEIFCMFLHKKNTKKTQKNISYNRTLIRKNTKNGKKKMCTKCSSLPESC